MNYYTILLIFIIFILAVITMVIYEVKLRKPRNKVHFYVARDKDDTLWLYIGKPIRDKGIGIFDSNEYGSVVTHGSCFENLGLNLNNYKDLKWEDGPVEVFLNMED